MGEPGIHRFGNLTIASFTFNPFSTNAYVVHGRGEAVLVDASASDDSEVDRVATYIEERRLAVRRALLTHAHIDHILGCAEFSRRMGVGWEIHPADLPLVQHAPEQAAMFGIRFDAGEPPSATLGGLASVELESDHLWVRHTPGHSPGSVSFVDAKERFAIVGDVLFNGSVGRTDLWEGSLPTLMNSIEQALLVLPDEAVVLSGHGPTTTIGRERAFNPFLS